MTTYTKNYIGKGKQVENLDIVKVTIKKADLDNCTHEYEGEDYVTFEVARMRNPDTYGRTHTCYFQSKEETEDKPKKPSRKKSKAKAAQDDLPF
ncbi:hypothetical protein [Sunxiuqinia sp. sy24]|uniref:hypothetical protein n=1 Tax=Sunxiuqinia sp. sy24 TaxID=3461495 RepID=UPI004045DC56